MKMQVTDPKVQQNPVFIKDSEEVLLANENVIAEHSS